MEGFYLNVAEDVGLHPAEVVRAATQDPDAMKARYEAAFTRQSFALAEIIWGFFVMDEAGRRNLLDICSSRTERLFK